MTEPKPKIEGIKGVVKHELKYRGGKPTLAYQLLNSCVLDKLVDKVKRSPKFRTNWLRKMFLIQYLRVIQKDPEHRLAYMYRINCPPPGFLVSPHTIACRRPQTCPWCYVRQWLVPACKALLAVPRELRKVSQVVTWQRMVVFQEPLPFFRNNYGPHQWCQALASVQIVRPWVPDASGRKQCYHFGLQIVPSDCDYQAELSRRSVRPGLKLKGHGRASVEHILKAMAEVAGYNWLDFCKKEYLEMLQQSYVKGGRRQRLLRIKQFKPQTTKEVNDGNQQPSVSAE